MVSIDRFQTPNVAQLAVARSRGSSVYPSSKSDRRPRMRPFTQAWIICGLFVLPATVSAQQPRVCDFEVEIRELVSRHDVIQRAQSTLSQLLREVPNDAKFRVGGTFFPDGSERLRRDTIRQFVSAARDFQVILKNVVIARKSDCRLCDLRFYHF